jgi:hypothetical protein
MGDPFAGWLLWLAERQGVTLRAAARHPRVARCGRGNLHCGIPWAASHAPWVRSCRNWQGVDKLREGIGVQRDRMRPGSCCHRHAVESFEDRLRCRLRTRGALAGANALLSTEAGTRVPPRRTNSRRGMVHDVFSSALHLSFVLETQRRRPGSNKDHGIAAVCFSRCQRLELYHPQKGK